MSPRDTILLRRAAWVILLAATGVFAWLSLKYLVPILLPFLIAWLLSLAIRPLVGKLAGDRRVARGITTAALVLLSVGLLAFGVFKGCERAVSELGRFAQGLAKEDGGIGLWLTRLSDSTASLTEHLPFLRRFSEHPAFDAFCQQLDGAVRRWATAALETLGQKIPAALMSFVGQLPSVLIFTTSLLLSCYYFSAHPDSPGKRLENLLPEAWQTAFGSWREKIKKALSSYLRAYVILSLLTFGEMFLGLSILKIPYAFLMAWVIALVDFLPLLGAGAVLVPWAAVCFITGDGGLATGLLVIFGIHTLLRQIIEPRLVSHELGLSPLVSLVAVYAGWRLLGIGGLIAAPLLLMIIKELFRSRTESAPAS